MQILNLEPPESGRIEVLGHDIAGLSRHEARKVRRNLQVVFQDPMASLDPRMPIGDILAEPLRAQGVPEAEVSTRVPELLRMVALVESALQAGACGASTGLEYTPGAFAPLAELIALSEPLAARRLPYSTHMRNEDDQLLDAIDESIAVAKGAKCPLQVAHLKTQGPRNWSKLDAVFTRIAEARHAGIDAAFDRYPYIAYQTGLTNLFPAWSRDGGTAAFLRRLDEPDASARIRAYAMEKAALIGEIGRAHV